MREKPDHHKKRFALMASASMTMAIFGVWSLVNFGQGGVLSQNTAPADQRVAVSENEVSPLESMQMNLASAFSALMATFGELKDGLTFGNSDVSEVREVKNNTFEIYGQ